MSEAVQAENISRETIASAVSIPLNERLRSTLPIKAAYHEKQTVSSIKNMSWMWSAKRPGIRWRCLPYLDLEQTWALTPSSRQSFLRTVRAYYNIERREDLRLSDYNTLAKVIDFMQSAQDSEPVSTSGSGAKRQLVHAEDMQATDKQTTAEELEHAELSEEISGEQTILRENHTAYSCACTAPMPGSMRTNRDQTG